MSLIKHNDNYVMDSPTQEWAKTLKAICQVDLFTFAYKVLGYKLLNERVHAPFCAFLTDSFLDAKVFPKLIAQKQTLPKIWHPNSLRRRHKMLLSTRDSYKTTLVSRSLPLWMLKEDPNMSIMICSEVKENAVKWLHEIKLQLRHNLTFRALYGDWVNPDKWQAEAIVIKPRTIPRSEPSIFVSGTTSTTTGQHPDCLLPETLVYTSNGYVPVKNIRIAHRVLSSDGKFHSVNNILKRLTNKSIIEIFPKYNCKSSKFTEDHKILIWRNDNVQWIEAGNLTLGDKLVLPRCKAHNRQASKVNDRINSLLTKPDIWRLIGYWLAEGCRTTDGYMIRLSFSSKELNYINDIAQIVKTHLGREINPSSYTPTKHNSCLVSFADKDFKEILKMFGERATDKHLPPFALNNSDHFQRQLLIGYFRGDGYLGGEGISACSVSYDLLTGIQLILSKFGIPCSINKAKEFEHKHLIRNCFCVSKPSWTLLSTHPMLKLLLGLNAKLNIKPFHSFFTDKYWIVPIKDIKKEIPEHEYDVFDIEVDEPHDFFCPNIIAHNCIVHDDLHSINNTLFASTTDIMESIILYWQEMTAQLREYGFEYVVGTRYCYGDLYDHIIEKHAQKYDILEQYAMLPNGKFWFPEHINETYLAERRPVTERQIQLHNAYYFGNMTPIGEHKLDVALIHKYEEYADFGKAPFNNMNYYLIIDPAVSQKRESSRTAIVLMGMTWDRNVYLIDYIAEKLPPDKAIEKSVDMIKKYYKQIKLVCPEVISGYEYFLTSLTQKLRDENIIVGVEPVKPHGLSKETRIMKIDGLEMCVNQGKFYCHKDHVDFLAEANFFPKGTTMDILDAVAYMFYIAVAPPQKIEKEITEDSIIWDRVDKMTQEKLKGLPEKKQYHPVFGVIKC